MSYKKGAPFCTLWNVVHNETFHIARSSNVVQKGRTLLYFRLDS